MGELSGRGFTDTPALCSAYDDVPLWSAPFGLALLDRVRLHEVRAALDVGCGSGFPLTELADRLGQGAHAVGLDPWANALDRARLKLSERGIRNASVVRARAEHGLTLSVPFACIEAVRPRGRDVKKAAETVKRRRPRHHPPPRRRAPAVRGAHLRLGLRLGST